MPYISKMRRIKAITQTKVLWVLVIMLSLIIIYQNIQYRYLKRDFMMAIEVKGIGVIAARQNIYKGSKITKDMTKYKFVHRDTFQQGDLTSENSVVGKIAKKDIFQDQHINASMLSLPKKIENTAGNK